MLRRTSLLRTSGDVALILDSKGDDAASLRGRVEPLTPNEALALELFAVRRSLESGVRALSRKLEITGPADALTIIVDLSERGLLVESPASSSARPSTRGMFGCRLASLSEIQAGDVVAYGMPYEQGVTGRRGTRSGPDYLRRASATAFDYVESDRALGWWHPQGRRRVLEGVRIRDIGDIDCSDSRRNGDAFDRLYKVQRRILQMGGFPVLLGGDHSISLAAIGAAAEVHPGLAVVQFDAHSDLGSLPTPAMGDWRRNASHGNFMSWVASNENVSRIHQFGVRHLLPEPPHRHDKVDVHGREAHVQAILAQLPKDRPYYLTFDVDCLDPTLVGQTGTPIPGGLDYPTTIAALRTVARELDLVGMDVVELTGADSLHEGALIAYLAFEVLAYQSMRRRDRAIDQDPVRVW